MHTHKQQIAIAVACGWHKHDCGDNLCWKSGTELMGITCRVYDLPDYLNDLDAMHEAEKVLTEAQRKSYAANLYKVVFQVGQYEAETFVDIRFAFILSQATATQRAEAFLRTLGLWEENE